MPEDDKFLVELLKGIKKEIHSVRGYAEKIAEDTAKNTQRLNDFDQRISRIDSKFNPIWNALNPLKDAVTSNKNWIKVCFYCILGLAAIVGVLRWLGMSIKLPMP